MNNHCEKVAGMYILHLRGDYKKSEVQIFCTVYVKKNVCFDKLYFLSIFIYFVFNLPLFWGKYCTFLSNVNICVHFTLFGTYMSKSSKALF